MGCGIFCLLLIVLWVRSYWRMDEVQVGRPIVIAVLYSRQGQLAFAKDGILSDWDGGVRIEKYNTQNMTESFVPSFYWHREGERLWAGFPHWFGVPLLTAIAGLPWLRWRVSLRTLLIATTVVAVGLGLLVMMLRGS
jgi:hypothetical protein